MNRFDRKKFKIKLDIYFRQYSEKPILLGIAILCMSIITARQNGTNYINQFAYGYSIIILLTMAVSQMSSIYGEFLRGFSKLNFTRKQYYLENIVLVLMTSGITTIAFFIAIMVNRNIFNRQQLVCFWYQFQSIDFISAIEIIILNFAFFIVIYMLGNLISVMCIGKKNVYAFILLGLFALVFVDILWDGKLFDFLIGFTACNKSYSLYLTGLLITAFGEYYIGKKLFMKKDID